MKSYAKITPDIMEYRTDLHFVKALEIYCKIHSIENYDQDTVPISAATKMQEDKYMKALIEEAEVKGPSDSLWYTDVYSMHSNIILLATLLACRYECTYNKLYVVTIQDKNHVTCEVITRAPCKLDHKPKVLLYDMLAPISLNFRRECNMNNCIVIDCITVVEAWKRARYCLKVDIPDILDFWKNMTEPDTSCGQLYNASNKGSFVQIGTDIMEYTENYIFKQAWMIYCSINYTRVQAINIESALAIELCRVSNLTDKQINLLQIVYSLNQNSPLWFANVNHRDKSTMILLSILLSCRFNLSFDSIYHVVLIKNDMAVEVISLLNCPVDIPLCTPVYNFLYSTDIDTGYTFPVEDCIVHTCTIFSTKLRECCYNLEVAPILRLMLNESA